MIERADDSGTAIVARDCSPIPISSREDDDWLRELGRVLVGESTLEEAIAAAQQETRRYAKRQITWLRHQMDGACRMNEQFSESILPKIFNYIRQFLLTMRG